MLRHQASDHRPRVMVGRISANTEISQQGNEERILGGAGRSHKDILVRERRDWEKNGTSSWETEGEHPIHLNVLFFASHASSSSSSTSSTTAASLALSGSIFAEVAFTVEGAGGVKSCLWALFGNVCLFMILFVRNFGRVCSQRWLSVRNSFLGPFGTNSRGTITLLAGTGGERSTKIVNKHFATKLAFPNIVIMFSFFKPLIHTNCSAWLASQDPLPCRTLRELRFRGLEIHNHYVVGMQ